MGIVGANVACDPFVKTLVPWFSQQNRAPISDTWRKQKVLTPGWLVCIVCDVYNMCTCVYTCVCVFIYIYVYITLYYIIILLYSIHIDIDTYIYVYSYLYPSP